MKLVKYRTAKEIRMMLLLLGFTKRTDTPDTYEKGYALLVKGIHKPKGPTVTWTVYDLNDGDVLFALTTKYLNDALAEVGKINE